MNSNGKLALPVSGPAPHLPTTIHLFVFVKNVFTLHARENATGLNDAGKGYCAFVQAWLDPFCQHLATSLLSYSLYICWLLLRRNLCRHAVVAPRRVLTIESGSHLIMSSHLLCTQPPHCCFRPLLSGASSPINVCLLADQLIEGRSPAVPRPIDLCMQRQSDACTKNI